MLSDRDGAQPRHAVVVERDMIVGLSLAQDLAELGYRVSGPFISAADLVPLLDDDRPDIAIVDPSLRDGSGVEAARAVKASGIPLVLFTAGGRAAHLDGEFRDTPWIEKPASTRRLLDALLAAGIQPPPT